MIAEVIVDIGGHDVLDYQIPETLPVNLTGCRVAVEVGSKQVPGLVRKVKEYSQFPNLKPILAVCDQSPVISEELLALFEYASEYYLTPLSRLTELAFPAKIKIKIRKEVLIQASESEIGLLTREEQDLLHKIASQQTDYYQISHQTEQSAILLRLQKEKLVTVVNRFIDPVESGKIMISYRQEPLKPYKAGGRPALLFDLIRQKQQILLDALKNEPAYHSAALQTLIKKESVSSKKISMQEYLSMLPVNDYQTILSLTADQQQVLEDIRKDTKPSLLFGVTGSGKTEIYIELMRDCLQKGQSVLFMVPEISLIAQTERRIKEKIGRDILHWHSQMTDTEKADTWDRLQTDTPQIVLGARSAIFAPIHNPGLIIIDEEHETSYKQNEPDPRYHAVHLAVIRARLADAKIVMGSATPSLQSYYQAVNGTYGLHTLQHRPIEARLPEVSVVNLKEEFKKGNRSVFSHLLQEKITETLQRKEQVILFLNRRGFSRFYLCRECGFVINCHRCSVPMIRHRSPELLKCHYCELVAPLPVKCPSCHSHFIKDMGIGTQKIETMLEESFEGAKVTRLDQDMITDRYSYERLLSDFSAGRTNILLGTQMVVKGLDFSNVTLVGIISADMSLYIPDLYAAERTFQLLTQVAGRAGRGSRKGQVVIQTYNPDHFSIAAARQHDYPSFYHQEMKERTMMNYPPFSKVIRFLITGENQQKTLEYTQALCDTIKETAPDSEILGPGEAPVAKIKNRYRCHFIIKTNDNFLHNYLKENYNKIKQAGQKQNIRILIDIEPYVIL